MMSKLNHRTGVLLGAALLLLAPVSAAAGDQSHRARYASQLARECDELLSWMVKRPYGWAWADAAPEPRPRGGAQAVDLEPAATPAAAFVLYWAGDLLDEAKYKEAAYQAARGLIAAEHPGGQVPARPVFLPASAGGPEAPVLVADRAASRAAVGVLLTLFDESGGKDDVLRRGAQHTLSWLLKQQPAAGAWPQGYPPATAPKDATRLTRLDTPDFRDSVLAMLLASDVLGDAQANLSVERSLEFLVRARVGSASKAAGALWATAYGLEAFPTNRIAEFPPGVDVLASRNAMQALFAAYVLRGGDPAPRGEVKVSWIEMLRSAAAAADKLPKFKDDRWRRLYYYDVAATPAPLAATTQIFAPTTAPAETPPAERLGTFGMDRMIDAVQALDDVGVAKVRVALMANLTIRQRLAAAVCGLEDDPLRIDLPVLDDEIADYLKRHARAFAVLDKPIPASVTERTRRLYVLWLRTKLEQRRAASR